MGLIRGRIPGGVAILWNKKLDSLVNVVRIGVSWCIAIQLTYQDKEFVILNVQYIHLMKVIITRMSI